MKAISKYFAMCAIALLGLANTSCMSDDMDGTPSCDYDVVLEYKVGGSATETRAAVTRAGETQRMDRKISMKTRLTASTSSFSMQPENSSRVFLLQMLPFRAVLLQIISTRSWKATS